MDRFSKNDHMVDILEGLKYISINKSGKLMNSVQRIDGRIWSTKSFKIVPPTGLTKDVKELSWMSHRVIRFWFLLKFLFISAFFDILASLSISRVFSSGILGQLNSCYSDIPRTIIKFDYMN